MKTAVIGASGFVGSRLLRRYRSSYPDCIGTCFRNHGTDLQVFDLGEPDVRPLQLVETGHESVVIAAAQAGIDACENDPDAARINVQGTLELVEQLGHQGVRVVFLSTDNVFDGKTGGYADDSPPNPPMAYGRQKAGVEREIGNLCARYTVARLSKTLGLNRGDGTLLDEMASMLVGGRAISAAYDLIFSPTWVEDVVEAIVAIQAHDLSGIVNVASPEPWSRYDLGGAIAQALRADPELVRRISFAELPVSANRPLNTSLIPGRAEAELSMVFRPVRECIHRVAQNWNPAGSG